MLEKAKKCTIPKKLESCVNNLRQTWKVFHYMPNKNRFEKPAVHFEDNGIVISNPVEIVEKFNNYLVNVGKNLSSLVPQSSVHFSSFLKNPILTSFTFN